MWLDFFYSNIFLESTGVSHSVEMFSRTRQLLSKIIKVLKKLWCYYRYYMWRPFARWVYWPLYRPFFKRRRLLRMWRRKHITKHRIRLQHKASALFWLTVSYIEHSPACIGAIIVDAYYNTKRFALSYKATNKFVSLATRFFRIYFKIVSFRRLLCLYIILDYFVYGWTGLPSINRDLRTWYMGAISAFYTVLFLLIDASDKKLTLNAHDFITRAYFRYYLKEEPSKFLTEKHLKDPIIERYSRIRHKRNVILIIFAYFYVCHPYYRS